MTYATTAADRDSERRTADSERRTADSGQRTADGGQRSGVLVRVAELGYCVALARYHLTPMRERLEVLPAVSDLKDLLAWQIAMDLAVSVYHATKNFPDDGRFGLRLQLRRAAVSVASNIAEGHGRINRREYARFVSIARGSLKEAETQSILSQRLNFLSAASASELLEICERLNQLLTGLKRKLRRD